MLASGPLAASEGGMPPKPVETETSWYAGQMGAVYAGTVGLLVLNGVTEARYPALAVSAGLGFTLGAPVLHAAHGNYATALESLALRGLFIGSVVVVGSQCVGVNGDANDSIWCGAGGALLVAELVAMPVLDFALSRNTVERAAPSTGVTLSMVPPSGSRPGLLALAGRF